MSRQSARYPPEQREQAVRLFAKVRPAYTSDQAAIQAVAGILGIKNPDVLRNWIRHGQIDPDSGRYSSSRMRAVKRWLFRPHTVIIGSIVAVLGGLGLFYSQQLLGIDQHSTPPKAPHLEVDQVGLTDAGSGSPDAPFKIDIKLLNTGTQLAAINSAELVIKDSITLPVCATQGDFLQTGSYKTYLPTNPKRGQVVIVPVSQLVPTDGADRFDLLLAPRMPTTDPGKLNIYIYRIHVYLTYNIHTRPLDIGEILMSYPKVPTGGDYFWSKYWAAHPHEFDVATNHHVAEVKACDVRNSYALRSIMGQPAMRTAETAAVPAQQAY